MLIVALNAADQVVAARSVKEGTSAFVRSLVEMDLMKTRGAVRTKQETTEDTYQRTEAALRA